jgi:hypothetical protein
MAPLSDAPKCRWARTPRLPAENYDSPAALTAPGSRRQVCDRRHPAGWAMGDQKKEPPQLRAFFTVAAALLSTFENVDDAGILPESN